MKKINYQKEIPVKYEVDVSVVGGGPAGLAAAVAAARQGVSVYLAESQGFFGGAATAALVPEFMPFANGKDFLAGGIGKEIFDRCLEEGFYTYYNTAMTIQAEKYKKILDDIVSKEKDIKFSFFTSLIDVITENGVVKNCVFAAKSGLFAIKAKVFIDGTGDGDLCAWAGADFELADENGVMMPATLCTIWNGIDWSNKNFEDAEKLEEAFTDGVFTQEDCLLPGMGQMEASGDLGGGNIGHCFGVDGTDEVSLTEGMLTGRSILPEYERYYQEYLSRGYEKAKIVISGSYLGIRETRRILGDYILTAEDYLNRARFYDEIGVFSYPVDMHAASASKKDYDNAMENYYNLRYEDGEFYGIPYRILLPRGLQNVFVAGRCVSTDRIMQASIRIMPGCFIMGQVAGAAASLAVLNNVSIREVDISELREILKNMGGFLPDIENKN